MRIMYLHANCEINTVKCLFECEIAKYSSVKFFRCTVYLHGCIESFTEVLFLYCMFDDLKGLRFEQVVLQGHKCNLCT